MNGAGRRAWHLKDIKAEPEAPLLTVCAVLWETAPLAALSKPSLQS